VLVLGSEGWNGVHAVSDAGHAKRVEVGVAGVRASLREQGVCIVVWCTKNECSASLQCCASKTVGRRVAYSLPMTKV